MNEQVDRSALKHAATSLQHELVLRCGSHGFRKWPRLRFAEAYTGGWYMLLGKVHNKLRLELWLDSYARIPQRRFWFGIRSLDLSQFQTIMRKLPSNLKSTKPVFTKEDFGKTGNKVWQLDNRLPHELYDVPIEEHYEREGYFYGIYDPLETWSPTALDVLVSKATDFFVQVIFGSEGAPLKSPGSTSKITRISFNSAEWRRPTGDARRYEAANTYNRKYGFGHEDWLFRWEWSIDGWRYAFIEGINKSHAKLVKLRLPLDLTLFTIEPDKRRRFVATIHDVECLDEQQAQDALAEFKKRGWYDIMRTEIKAETGDDTALGDPRWAKHILNVRFRKDNVTMFPPKEFAAPNDPIMKLSRYQLYDRAPTVRPTSTRRGNTQPPNVRPWVRRSSGPIECTPEHARMQARLMKELASEFPIESIMREEGFVDVSVRTATGIILFEIKSDLNPRSVIRQALGQILEYAYHPTRQYALPIRLVIVGRHSLATEDQKYIRRLQDEFALPLTYRVVATS